MFKTSKGWSFRNFFPVILILVSIGASVFFRCYNRSLPLLDKLAAGEVYEAQDKAIAKTIHERYPNISAASAVKIKRQLLKDSLKASAGQLQKKVRLRAGELKDRFRDDRGRVYLNGIDSYYWLRLLRNLIRKGHIGDSVVSGAQYDDLIASPIEPATSRNIHLWLGLAAYKTAVFFNKDCPLETAVFYVPVFISVFIAFLSFYLAKRLGSGGLGAFFASLTINLSPFLMSRLAGEWFDTDIYNVFFPLLIFCLWTLIFQAAGRVKSLCLFILCGLSLAGYASTWKGWWFIFDILFFSGLFFVLNQKLSQKETGLKGVQIKRNIFNVLLFFFVGSLFVWALNGFGVWSDFIREPLRLLKIFEVPETTLWPNVYLTVAELGRLAPFEVLRLLGGGVIFFGGLAGLLCVFLFCRGSRDSRYGPGLWCLAIWILAVFYSAVEASRFVLLLVVPVGLAFGLAVSKAYALIEKTAARYLAGRQALLARALAVFLISLQVVLNIAMSSLRSAMTLPQLDDYWHRSLLKIKEAALPQAVINSWWDFGHWFKAVAQRRVLFDGMTQNTPYAYWMAAALLTADEKQSVGILRMINTGAFKAVELLEKRQGLAAGIAVDILKNCFSLDRRAAAAYLKDKQLLPEVQEELEACLFPGELPPVYFIVSYDMAAKIGPISYIGNWDFKKADLWFKKRKHRGLDSEMAFLSYATERYGLTKQEAGGYYLETLLLDEKSWRDWVSSPLGYLSPLSPAKEDGPVLFFENGLVVNRDNLHAYIAGDSAGKRGVPKSLVFLEQGQLKEELQKEARFNFSALMVKDGQEYKSMLMDADFAKSMLARLYFLKGEGLKYFKLFSREEDEKGNAIYVYEIQWPDLFQDNK